MTYSPTIYDWRSSLVPIDQVFRAGGQAYEGGLTAGGVFVRSPEPGGRAELMMRFPEWRAAVKTNRDASWTVSRILNNAVMRIKLCSSVQLVPAADLGEGGGGIPWANGILWEGGSYWEWDPTAPVNAAASKGAASFEVDLSSLGEVLQIGHVVGFTVDGGDFAHMVMDISYDASDVATVEVSPPLRRALTTSDVMKFRPKMLVTCANPREVLQNGGRRKHVQLGSARFVEALI